MRAEYLFVWLGQREALAFVESDYEYARSWIGWRLLCYYFGCSWTD